MTEIPQLPEPELSPKTEVLHSVHYEIGSIPNTDELMQNPLFMGKSWELSVHLGPDQLPLAFRAIPINDFEVTDTERRAVLDLMLPTAKLMDAARRSEHHRSDTIMWIGINDQISKPNPDDKPIEQNNQAPHWDDGGGVFFFGAIGAQTLFWDADFEVPSEAPREEKIAAIIKQIEQEQIEPTIPESGVVSAVTDQTIHASPSADQSIAGHRRIFFRAAGNRPENIDLSSYISLS